MGGWNGYGWGGMGMGGISMVLFWIVIIVGIVLTVKWLTGRDDGAESGRRRSALDILEERYARGEIEREEYEQKKRDLSA